MRSTSRTTALTVGALALAVLWVVLFRLALRADLLLLLASLIAILLWVAIRLVGRAAATLGRRRRTSQLAELAKQCSADDVRFAVRRPPFLVPETWTPLLVQAYRSEQGRAADARDGAVAQLELEAERLLGGDADAYVTATEDGIVPVPRDALLRFVPDVPGCRFNPPVAMAEWSEATLSVAFRMKADRELDGDTARGQLSIFAGPLMLAEMAIVVRVTSQPQEPVPAAEESVVVAPYRRVFASYSHRDEPIVRQMEVFARALGDDFMRDVTQLRAGEEWSPRIAQMIEDADVFQLFWSSHSMNSTYVATEWRHALSLRRQNFIRPIYWEEPLPASPDGELPPAELKRIHFQRLPLEDLGVRRAGFARSGSTAALAMLAGVIFTMQLSAPGADSPVYAPPDESDPLVTTPFQEPPPPPDQGIGGSATGMGSMGGGGRGGTGRGSAGVAGPDHTTPSPASPMSVASRLPGTDVLEIGAFASVAGDSALERAAGRIAVALRSRQAAPGAVPDTTGVAVGPALVLTGSVAREDSLTVVELTMWARATNEVVWSSRVYARGSGGALDRAVIDTVVARTGGRGY